MTGIKDFIWANNISWESNPTWSVLRMALKWQKDLMCRIFLFEQNIY